MRLTVTLMGAWEKTLMPTCQSEKRDRGFSGSLEESKSITAQVEDLGASGRIRESLVYWSREDDKFMEVYRSYSRLKTTIEGLRLDNWIKLMSDINQNQKTTFWLLTR